jgi:hypothetical protein
MGTGKPRISTAVQLAGRVVQVELALGPVQAELEHVQVQARELETVPVVAPKLVIGLAVVPELETAPVVAPKLVIDLAVVPGLETAPVVALELELVQVAVPLRTRSVTAAHRPGLVLHLLVAVAETTREPAAAEAVIAWEVAE